MSSLNVNLNMWSKLHMDTKAQVRKMLFSREDTELLLKHCPPAPHPITSLQLWGIAIETSEFLAPGTVICLDRDGEIIRIIKLQREAPHAT